MPEVPYVNMQQQDDEYEALIYYEPKRYIQRYNRCKWIMIVTLVWTALMLGLMIPGIVGLSQGDIYDDTMLYFGIACFVFAGLFLTFWYICQYEVEDVASFQRERTQKSVKRIDGPGQVRPKSLRSNLKRASTRRDESMEEISLVDENLVV